MKAPHAQLQQQGTRALHWAHAFAMGARRPRRQRLAANGPCMWQQCWGVRPHAFTSSRANPSPACLTSLWMCRGSPAASIAAPSATASCHLAGFAPYSSLPSLGGRGGQTGDGQGRTRLERSLGTDGQQGRGGEMRGH